jgi:hypothetical protein
MKATAIRLTVAAVVIALTSEFGASAARAQHEPAIVMDVLGALSSIATCTRGGRAPARAGSTRRRRSRRRCRAGRMGFSK